MRTESKGLLTQPGDQEGPRKVTSEPSYEVPGVGQEMGGRTGGI